MATALTLSLAFALSCLLAAANPLRLLVLLPILAGAAELVENTILFVVVSNFPSEAGSFAGFVTSVKLVLAEGKRGSLEHPAGNYQLIRKPVVHATPE